MSNFTAAEYDFMARALRLAEKGRYTTHPNPRVGCVIVKQDHVIGEGYHKRAGEPHAEINALQAVNESPAGATVYVTLEPCSHTGKTPPCADALIDAGVSRVVIAMQDPNPEVAGQGIKRLQDAGITVDAGLLEAQARKLNPGFIKRMEQGLPWLRLKLAMSLDGRTAMASGESKWITGSAARHDVQKLRASADAILTGIGTVLADDPALNVRLEPAELGIEGEVRQPLRVVVDSHLKMPFDAQLMRLNGDTIIATRADNDDKLLNAFQSLGVQIVPIETAEDKHVNLHGLLATLAKQEINEVHVEAGATLCGALIQQKLVDEIIIYMAPILMGSDAKGLLNLPGLTAMADKIALNIEDMRAIDKDWRLTLSLKSATE